MARKPAYANRLIEARKAGQHPASAVVVFGHQWRGYAEPILAIKPEEYEPGMFDFRAIAGLPVDVVDQVGEWRLFDDWPALYWLAAEVAEWAAEVQVHSVAWEENSVYGRIDMEILAQACRLERWAVSEAPHWPSWWPEKLNEDYGRRNQQYWLERRAPLEAVCGGVQ